jgi:hypothetical protein
MVYTKIKFLFEKEFFLHFRPSRPSGQSAHPAFRPTQPTRPSSSSPRQSSVASFSIHSTVPWMPPPPSPAPWSHNGHPPNNFPPLQSAVVTTPHPSLPVMAAMKAPITTATRYSRPPPPPSRPYRRAPTLRWSTSPLHLGSSPPQSCPRRDRLELKPHRRCTTSSPSFELR